MEIPFHEHLPLPMAMLSNDASEGDEGEANV